MKDNKSYGDCNSASGFCAVCANSVSAPRRNIKRSGGRPLRGAEHSSNLLRREPAQARPQAERGTKPVDYLGSARNNYIIRIASFLIFLIITLPMNGSLAVAASLNSANAYGKAEIPGFRAMTDITVVNVTATITEDSDISTGQVKILEDPTVPFECSILDEATSLWGCKAEFAEVALPSSIGVLPFTVQVFNDAGSPISPPRQGSLVVDAKPPKIVGDPGYASLPGGIVEATYHVIDESCDKPQCANRCAGIARVGFSVAGLNVGEGVVEDSACEQKGKVNLTGLIAGEDVQTKHICVEAVDKLGQSSSKCKDVLVDTRPPLVEVGLYDSNNKRVTYTNGLPACNLNILVNLTEDSRLVNPRITSSPADMIIINASQLSERADHQLAFSNLQATCKKKSVNTYECSYGGLCLIATAPRDISVHIEAADEFGNIFNGSKAVSVSFDNTPPVATKIYTNFSDDKNIYWMRAENNTIKMDITESGSGMSNNGAIIDLSGFGPQVITSSPTLVPPYECVSGWTCLWHWVQTNKESGTSLYLKPLIGSKDDAGNAMAEVTSTIKVDRSAPLMLRNDSTAAGAPVYLNVTAMSELGTTAYVTSGDMITIRAYVEDHTPIRIFANFSGILPVEGQDNVESICTEMTTDSADYSAFLNEKRRSPGARFWECVWEVGPVVEVPRDITHPWENTTIMFHIEDLLGNNADEKYYMKIYGEENETGNYWKYDTVSVSPSQGLDRFIWGLGQPVAFQRFTLKPLFGGGNENKLKIFSFELDSSSCVGDKDYLYYGDNGAAGVTYMGFSPITAAGIDDVIMEEFNPTNVPPATYTDLNNVSHPLEKIRFNCTASITSIVYDARVSLPEKENFTFEVPIFGNPLGTNIGNVKDEIDSVEEDVTDWDWLVYPKLIFDYAGIVCNLISTLNTVLGVLTYVGILEGDACLENQIMCGASSELNTGLGEQRTAMSSMLGKFNIFCGLVISCRATTPQAIDSEAVEQPDGSFKCSDSDDTWCAVQMWWAQWMNSVISWFSGSALLETNDAADEYLNRPQQETQAGGRDINNITFMSSSDIRGSFDPKKSLIASTLSLCLPGIFSNAEKYRQLRCEWLLCAKIDVAYGGMTLSQCDDLFQYGLCKYILGDIWNAVPLFQFANQLLSTFTDIIEDPILLAGYAIDYACSTFCGGEPGPSCGICTGIEFIGVLSQITASIYGMADSSFWTAPMDSDICEEAVKDEPKYSNIPGFPAEADPEQQAQQPPEEDTGATA